MPGVEPLVYIGQDENEINNIFQDTVSYVRFGSYLTPNENDNDDMYIYCIPNNEIGEFVFNLEDLIAEFQKAFQRAILNNWPKLPILQKMLGLIIMIFQREISGVVL